MTARIALTFDYHPQVMIARDIMFNAGIYTGTYYAWYPNIVTGTPTGAQVGVSDLVLMRQVGWEIGAYTQDNMVTKLSNNRVAANDFLRDIDSGMNSAGFKVSTIAPNSRSWNASLANLCRGRFIGVRVAASTSSISYPLSDPLYVNAGGSNSWGSDATANAGSNTPAAILARCDAQIANGGETRIEVIHKVGNAAAVAADPAYTFLDTDFATIMAGYASRISAGTLKLITMEQALTA